jgi:hypothetical protein
LRKVVEGIPSRIEPETQKKKPPKNPKLNALQADIIIGSLKVLVRINIPTS